MLRLPKLLDDGCVLQASMPITIWGWAEPSADVSVSVQNRAGSTTAGDDGSWSVTLDSLEPGGPFTLSVEGSDGSRITREVYAGEVYLCSGQSNMELPMAWGRPEYASEFSRPADPLLRQYKVIPEYDFAGSHDDHTDARWTACDAQGTAEFSQIGYFFGRMMREHLGVPVGLLNVSLGGSPIESWMDKASLRRFPDMLSILRQYAGEGVAVKRSEDSIAARDEWYRALGYDAAPDTGSYLPLGQWPWRRDDEAPADDLQWHDITLPNWFADQGLAGFRGELELRKIVYLPAHMEERPAFLRLGTMADAEHTWLNGYLLGGRTNQYEPRDYEIPAGVLHGGANELRLRLVCEHDTGRVTPGKAMTLSVGDDVIDVSGIWRYAIVTVAQTDCPWEDFVRWKPTALYNTMLAPCFPYRVRAALWYQGESNTGDSAPEYRDLLESMIGLWRRQWHQERLPFLIVQLPNFAIDCVEDGGWPVVREAQWQVAQTVADVATVVAIDAGDWNDLHPTHKKIIANRLFQAARQLVYGESNDYRQPCLAQVHIEGSAVELTFEDRMTVRATGAGWPQSAPSALATLDGKAPGEFTFVWNDGGCVPARATIDSNRVTVPMPARTPDELRYAWRNNPDNGLLCNAQGVPVTPLRVSLRALMQPPASSADGNDEAGTTGQGVER